MSFQGWEKLSDLLYRLSEREVFKPNKDDIVWNKPVPKGAAELISPATYKPGSTRANSNVINWNGWACIDVDEYEGSFEEIINSFGDYHYVCYSTGSSSREHPKFRLVFPLECPVKADKIGHFWHALNSEFLGVADAQTKDLSRMFYVPGKYRDAFNFIFTNEGPWIDPYVLMKKYPYHERSRGNLLDRLPPDIKAKILEQKKIELNRDLTWSSYKNCPFVNQNLVSEYMAITGSGWYHTMYRLMVSIAATAINRGFDINADDISQLCKELDAETGGWYKSRNMKTEAQRAIEWVYMNGK